MVHGSGFMVQGLELWVLGFRVWGKVDQDDATQREYHRGVSED